MKLKIIQQLGIFTISFLFITQLSAQEKFTVPELTSEQKQEILYSHVIAYDVAGIRFAKSQGVSPQKYGEYIGDLFKPFWNPEEGFPAFANGMLFILTGMHPDNEMQIVQQSEKMLEFKLKNVDSAFKMGPVYNITYEEFLACSYGTISVLAEYMNVEFSHKMNDGWYVVKLVAK